MDNATCWTLIDGAKAGDAPARREFAARYQPVVVAYLRARWNGRSTSLDLDDAVQDVFVECLKPGGALERAPSERERSFRAFLYGVVRNVALRFESAVAQRMTTPRSEAFDADALSRDEPSLTRVFDRAWAEALLRAAAARQARSAEIAGPEQVRRVEILRQVFQEERTLAELARSWDVDEDVLRRDYARARAEFLRALTEVVTFNNPDRPESVARECRELAQYFAQ